MARPIFAQSASERRPLRIFCESTSASLDRIRWVSSTWPISSENTNTGRPLCLATWVAIPRPIAVFPIEGRAPTMFSVDGCRPDSSSSRSLKPVAMPVIVSPRAKFSSMRSTASFISSPMSRYAVDDAAVGDAEHPALGVVEGIVDVVRAAVADLGDVGGDEDEAAQHRRVLHDLGVGRGVGDRRGGVLQGVQRLDAAGLFEQSEPRQLVGDGDRVDRAAGLRDGYGDVEDVLVAGLVEVVVAQPGFDDRAEGVTRQQDGAEHRLLGLQVVRRDPPAAGERVGPAAVPRGAGTVGAIHPVTLSVLPCAHPWERAGNRVGQLDQFCGPPWGFAVHNIDAIMRSMMAGGCQRPLVSRRTRSDGLAERSLGPDAVRPGRPRR